MKCGKILLVLFLLTVAIGCSSDKSDEKDYGYIVKIGEQAPTFEAFYPNGEKFTEKNLIGKITMIQFTASWCGVCRKEMPHIETRIWNKYKSNQKFQLIGIDLDEPLNKVNDFKASTGITYPLLLDPDGKAFYKFAAEGAGVTRNIIVNEKGEIVFLTRLFKEKEFNKMINKIDNLLQ